MIELSKNGRLSCFSLFAITLLTVCSLAHISRAQDTSVTLPDGFGSNELQTTENLSSGVLNINLPIESFLVPISIGYSTSGIRVNQREGIVGLGWKLNAGGLIYRQKRGLADTDDNGYCGNKNRGKEVVYRTGDNAFRAQVIEADRNARWDTHPDVYYFEFMGQSGQFTFDSNRQIVKLTQNNLQIFSDFDSDSDAFVSFTIRDENGNSYLFNNRGRTVQKKDEELLSTYWSRWYLTKITEYATGDQIYFHYDKWSRYSRSDHFNWRKSHYDPNISSNNYKIFDEGTYTIATEQDTYYLTKITVDFAVATVSGSPVVNNCEAVFLDCETECDWLSTEEDGDYGSCLQICYNNLRTCREQVEADKTKFEKNTNISFFYGFPDGTTEWKLTKIEYTVNGGKKVAYNLHYNNLGSGPASRSMLTEVSKSTLDSKLYQFVYFGQAENEHTLPDYESNARDHWGYYNANQQTHRFDTWGANRNPDLSYTLANSLKRIYHTAGGFTEYTYQLNDYQYNPYVYKKAGGLRIAQIRKGDHEGNFYPVRTYSYTNNENKSSGQLYAEPLYQVNMSDNGDDFREHREYSYVPLQDHLGRHITYQYVTVNYMDASREQYEFYTFADEVIFDTNTNIGLTGIEWDPDKIPKRQPSAYSAIHPGPFGYKSFQGTTVGIQKQKNTYDYANQLVTTEEYSYFPVQPKSTVLGMNAALFGFGSGDLWYNVDYYKMGNGFLQLNQARHTSYDINDQQKKLTNVTDYEYNADYHLPTKVVSYRLGASSENVVENHTQYLFESPGNLSGLLEANLIAPVKQRTMKKGNQNISMQSTSYGLNHLEKVVPTREQVYAYKDNRPGLVNDQSFTYHESTNKLVKVTNNQNENVTSQIWDDEGIHIIAEISNSAPQHCAFSSFEGNDTGQWEGLEFDDSNVVVGLIGERAYSLAQVNINKNLAASRPYTICYWYKSGSVTLSGLTNNKLISTRSVDGWVFEERLIQRSTKGNLTLSGTAIVDHLSLSPKDALMTTYTYHSIFGKTSETDANSNTVFYEYDEAGRVKNVRDKNLDLISNKAYQITPFVHASISSVFATSVGKTVDLFVSSNGNWTIGKSGWIDITQNSGNGFGKVTATIQANRVPLSRSGNIAIQGADGASHVIAVSQEASPTDYIALVPSTVKLVGTTPQTISVLSDISAWRVVITSDPRFRILVNGSRAEVNGSGDGSFEVSYNDEERQPEDLEDEYGQPKEAIVTIRAWVDGQSISAQLNITY